MIVVKPGYTQLTLDNLKDNYRIEYDSKFTLTYSVYDRHKPKLGQKLFNLGYYEILGEKELDDYLKWVSDKNYTAILHCSNFKQENIYKEFPIFFKDNQFCLTFEGFKDEGLDEMIDRFASLPKSFNEITSVELQWMFNESMDQKDVIVTLDNESVFNCFNNWSSYDDEGILYCQYGRPYKNFKQHHSPFPPRGFGYHY